MEESDHRRQDSADRRLNRAPRDKHQHGLGDPVAITTVAKAYRVQYNERPLAEGGYTHTVIVYRIGKDGRFIFPFSFKRPTEAAVADLRKYV